MRKEDINFLMNKKVILVVVIVAIVLLSLFYYFYEIGVYEVRDVWRGECKSSHKDYKFLPFKYSANSWEREHLDIALRANAGREVLSCLCNKKNSTEILEFLQFLKLAENNSYSTISVEWVCLNQDIFFIVK